MAQKKIATVDGAAWPSNRYFWQMARPRIASLIILVNSDCFLLLLILTKFCTRATAGGAAIFKLNAAIFKAMWLTHTHAHTHTDCAL